MTTPTNQSKQEDELNPDEELFQDSFHQWLEAHGVELSPMLVGDKFISHINLNELKPAIMQLIYEKQARAYRSGFVDGEQSHNEARDAEAEKRGVAWTIGVIDDLHIYRDYDLVPESDKMFKGIKNTIRGKYKFLAGVDPAPSYPIDVTLTTHPNEHGEK